MRPRLITAENVADDDDDPAVGVLASMRPRLITAENARGTEILGHSAPRFNEAAAHHRGEQWRAANAQGRRVRLQ